MAYPYFSLLEWRQWAQEIRADLAIDEEFCRVFVVASVVLVAAEFAVDDVPGLAAADPPPPPNPTSSSPPRPSFATLAIPLRPFSPPFRFDDVDFGPGPRPIWLPSLVVRRVGLVLGLP